MPNKPPTHDPRGRTPAERLAEKRAFHDKKREREQPWRAWYRTPRWRALRAWVLRRDPACILCLEQGKLTPSQVADHLVEHKGDPVLFYDPFNIWGLCKTCHNSTKQRVERSLAGLSKEQVKAVYASLRETFRKYVTQVTNT